MPEIEDEVLQTLSLTIAMALVNDPFCKMKRNIFIPKVRWHHSLGGGPDPPPDLLREGPHLGQFPVGCLGENQPC